MIGNDISDWRALTLRHSKSLQMENRELAEKTAKYLANLFHPWIIGDPENLTVAKGVETYRYPPRLLPDLTELCQAAYDLTVMLRQSTDKYSFIPIEEGTEVLSQEQDMFEPQDIIGPKSKYVGSKVWVNLFGALVKESQLGNRHIMMKALVVCKAHPPVLPDRSGSPRKQKT
jgi:hypothetical protein